MTHSDETKPQYQATLEANAELRRLCQEQLAAASDAHPVAMVLAFVDGHGRIKLARVTRELSIQSLLVHSLEVSLTSQLQKIYAVQEQASAPPEDAL